MVEIASALARLCVARALEGVLEVRWHGLGMLQVEFSDKVRVHLWHRKLMRLPPDSLRRVHDHRFDIHSVVVAGLIDDQTWLVDACNSRGGAPLDAYPFRKRADGVRDVSVHRIKHAKVQTGEDDSTFETVARAVPLDRVTRKKGADYHLYRRDFHTSYPPEHGVAVTVVERTNFDGESARVLDEPDVRVTPSGIHGGWTREEGSVVHHVLVSAREALGG